MYMYVCTNIYTHIRICIHIKTYICAYIFTSEKKIKKIFSRWTLANMYVYRVHTCLHTEGYIHDVIHKFVCVYLCVMCL